MLVYRRVYPTTATPQIDESAMVTGPGWFLTDKAQESTASITAIGLNLQEVHESHIPCHPWVDLYI